MTEDEPKVRQEALMPSCRHSEKTMSKEKVTRAEPQNHLPTLLR